MHKNPIFIAEIKTQSPYGFQSPFSFMQLMEIACKNGDWISVHTNSLWGGDFAHIEFVRSFCKKPILAKGLHTTTDSILRAFESGANYVLTTNPNICTATMPRNDWFKLDNYKDKILFEMDFATAKPMIDFNPSFKSRKYVSNLRNLKTGEFKPREINKETDLNQFLNAGLSVCQASGIRYKTDVHRAVDSYIVGTHLMEFCKSNFN